MRPLNLISHVPVAIALSFAATVAMAQNPVTATAPATRSTRPVSMAAKPVLSKAAPYKPVHVTAAPTRTSTSSSRAVHVATAPTRSLSNGSSRNVQIAAASTRSLHSGSVHAVRVSTASAVRRNRVRAAVRPAPAARVSAVTPVRPNPFSENPILQLRGNARALLVFSPDSQMPAMKQQMALLDQHSLELTKRDTVFVPIVTNHHGADDVFPGENITPTNYRDQLSAHQKFGLKYNEFAVIVLDKDGNEQFRSKAPVTVAELEAHLN